MNNLSKRLFLFLIGCIGARFSLTYLIKTHNIKYRNMLIGLLCLIGIGFLYIYINDLRKTGIEVFGDKIWWNHLRPIHGILYLLTAIFLYNNNKDAYLIIFTDTLIGLIAFFNFRLTKLIKN
jgi:hypothetical protein